MRGVESKVLPSYAQAWECASREIIDAWEKSVKLSLQAQLDWVRCWTLRLGDEDGSPPEVVEWSRQTYELMKAWIDAQLEMWNAWFASLRTLGPRECTESFVEVSLAWHEAVRKSLDASAEWTRTWPAHVASVTASGNGAKVT